MVGLLDRFRRPKWVILGLAVAVIAAGWWTCRANSRKPRPTTDVKPADTRVVLRNPTFVAADSALPPSLDLLVSACTENEAPVELFGFVGASGWDGGTPSTLIATCDPDSQGKCAFSGLTAGAGVLRQGATVIKFFLEADTLKAASELDLPCESHCAVDLVVEADPACGDHGVLRLLPPVPLPTAPRFDSDLELAWTTGQTQRIGWFPCQAAAAELESDDCQQIRTVADSEGAPLRTLRLRLQALDRMTLRFVDRTTGSPVPGVILEDVDGWTVHVSDHSGSVEVVKQSRQRSMTVILEAHHPAYQSTSVYPPAMEGDVVLVVMHPRQEFEVECSLDGAPCPGRTRVHPSFLSGPSRAMSQGEVGADFVQGECVWHSPGLWRCERGRDTVIYVELDGRVVDVPAMDGAERIVVDMSTRLIRACLRASWPSDDCMLELAETVHPVRRPTVHVPLPDGDGPVAGRVVCQDSVTWAEVLLDRGGACTSPGPWSELAGICARPKPGPAVEDSVGDGCVLLDAAAVMGEAAPYASSTPLLLERCPSWFPPGNYFIACGEGVAQPVTLIEGEVLEWAPHTPRWPE